MTSKHPRKRPTSFADLPPDDLLCWLQERRDQLAQKQQRERAYLDRRAKRGISTPTDEAYERDQQLETDLLLVLDTIISDGRKEAH